MRGVFKFSLSHGVVNVACVLLIKGPRPIFAWVKQTCTFGYTGFSLIHLSMEIKGPP